MATFLGAEEFKRNTRQKKVNLEEEVELISDSGKYFKDFFFCMVCFQNLIQFVLSKLYETTVTH